MGDVAAHPTEVSAALPRMDGLAGRPMDAAPGRTVGLSLLTDAAGHPSEAPPHETGSVVVPGAAAATHSVTNSDV